MTDQPFNRDRLGLPVGPPVQQHGPGEPCNCSELVNPPAAEFITQALREELDADLVLVVAPITGGAACLATPLDRLTTARILRAVADDLTAQHGTLS